MTISARREPGWRSDAGVVLALALAVRLAVVAWAAPRFPPAGDGEFYHRIAERIAAGLGYTWLWPDGVVTYAAHYPVGYPAAAGAVYAIAGPHPAGAMALNAVLGAVAALAVHRLAARAGSRRGAALGGGLVALHPGLVAYTPALMTEGVTASLLAVAAWAAAWARDREATRPSLAPYAVVGVVIGAATLVRPQSLLLAPVLAWLASAAADLPAVRRGRWLRRAAPALIATAAAVAVCGPWTARNCLRMGRCTLVSFNGGWNLLIGADAGSTGGWAPIQVPAACREVFDEARKDACFAAEARKFITERPGDWLALVPRKLAATFDYCGAAGWYLHASNPEAFSEERKVVLGAVETVFERVVLLLCVAWAARGVAVGRRARVGLLLMGAISALYVHAWVGYVVLLNLSALQGRRLLAGPVLAGAALAVLAATALTHAVFFGGGRYALVVFPLLTGLAALGVPGASGEAGSDFDSAARGAASYAPPHGRPGTPPDAGTPRRNHDAPHRD